MKPPTADETWELQAGFNLKLKLGPSLSTPFVFAREHRFAPTDSEGVAAPLG